MVTSTMESGTDLTRKRVIENMSTSVMVLNRDLEVEYINPACEMLFEISRRKAIGRSWSSLVKEKSDLSERMKESVTEGHPFTQREVPIELYAGRMLTVDCNLTPLYEPSAPPCLLVELQYMERQLQISKEENLISQSHAARALVRGLAHEIKNPLGGLRGAAQLLEREFETEELKEYTQIIIGEADRLQALVDRMLGPTALPKRELINIHQVLEHVYSLVNIDLPDNIEIKRDYDPSIPELYADPDQLIQATLNLVRNAIQAVADKGVVIIRSRSKRQFTIGHQRYKLVVVVEIIDNGKGIASDMLEQVFLPMITGRAEGTGLGLSIAQSLINRHHGLIECTSEPGQTVFRILLPLETEYVSE